MTRPTVFWVAIAVIVIAMLVLLHDILMPFVLGMLTAYLLEPIVDRLEKAGINRSLVAVSVALLLVVAFAAVIGQLDRAAAMASKLEVGRLVAWFECH